MTAQQLRSSELDPAQHEQEPSVGKIVRTTALLLGALSIYAMAKYGTVNPINALTALTYDTM